MAKNPENAETVRDKATLPLKKTPHHPKGAVKYTHLSKTYRNSVALKVGELLYEY